MTKCTKHEIVLVGTLVKSEGPSVANLSRAKASLCQPVEEERERLRRSIEN